MGTTNLGTDLASSRYSTAAATFLALWGGLATPGGAGQSGVYFDGDFTVDTPVGHHIVEFPFANQGDAVSQIVRQRFWQLAANFKSTALGTPSPGRSDWLLIDEENFRDEGGGVISWDRVYATIPQDRDEFEDFSNGFQYVVADSSGKLQLSELAIPVPSRVRYTYFHVKDLNSQTILLALRIIKVGDNVYVKQGKGNLSQSGSFIISSDPQIVAEPSKLRTWKYPIMYLKTRWIDGPTADFWGESFNLPI